jgi:hypothetical protein
LRERSDGAQAPIGLVEFVGAVRNTVAAGADGFEPLRSGSMGGGRQQRE